MEFADVVRRRRMVRQFEDRPLAPEVVERILATALRAPSAGFAQGWEFLVLTSA
ncbi:MAG: nitroreductase family protein, partial [Hamadaea sp.]|nr:nitroreductase family protein [Hamadaea sp.]